MIQRKNPTGKGLRLVLCFVSVMIALCTLGGCAHVHSQGPKPTQKQTPDFEPTPVPTPAPTATPYTYDYSRPMPKSDAVDDDYFDDAIFLGNSLMEGFGMYCGLKKIKFYADVGMSVKSFFTKDEVTYKGTKMSASAVLGKASYEKVYILLGTNELGWPGTSNFVSYYGRIINRVRDINPDAEIYVLAIWPVSAKTSDNRKYVNNPMIETFNEALQDMCNEKQVYFIDAGECLRGADGALPPEKTFDGVHLQPKYYKDVLEYLRTHTIQGAMKYNNGITPDSTPAGTDK